MSNDHTHDHSHSHTHSIYDVDPHDDHAPQADIEDEPLSRFHIMQIAVTELLIEKNLFSADQMRRQIETIDAITPARGAGLVAKAWVDPDFKARLIEDANKAAKSIGMDIGPIPILAMENTPDVHNVIVCTLCSCYPRMLIGLPPDWYKSREYRSRMIKEPRKVLSEFGTTIGNNVNIHVHDSTADMRYMVIPMRPVGTDNLNEEQLAELVTRDTMVGVAVATTASVS